MGPAQQLAAGFPAWVVISIVLIGGLATLATAIAATVGVTNNRKTRQKMDAERDKATADTAKALTDTAMTLVNPLKQKVTDLEGRVDHWEEQWDAQQQLIDAHSVWDRTVVWLAERGNLALPPMPPLYLYHAKDDVLTEVKVEVTTSTQV